MSILVESQTLPTKKGERRAPLGDLVHVLLKIPGQKHDMLPVLVDSLYR